MRHTLNASLNLPGSSDPVDINDLNENFEIIDTHIGKAVTLGSDGKIDPLLIHQQSITDVFEASSEADMLALEDCHAGDVCIRSDVGKTFILKANPAATLSNWVELPIPPNLVLSVAGKIGAIVLTPEDVGLGDSALAAKVLATILAGLDVENSVITAGDDLLDAIGKAQGQITHLKNNKAPKSTTVNVTLTAAGWNGAAAPFTQALTIAGITADANAEVGVAMSRSSEQFAAAGAAMIQATAQSADTVVFTAEGEKPTVNIPITIVIFG